MMVSMENDAFITVFVEMIKKKGIAKYGDHSKFSRAIFGPDRSSVVKWRNIRNGNAKGQRDIKLDDMLNISAALGEPLPSLIFQADEMLKMLLANNIVTVPLSQQPTKQRERERERERESNLCAEKMAVPNNAETVKSND